MKETASGLKIVSVGGGTGLSTLLSGLKAFVGKDPLSSADRDASWIETLTAVVTVTDDGGSSGRLRDGLVRHDPDKLARLVLEIRQAEKLALR